VLDLAHHRELGGRGIALQFADLEPADAVLGAKTPAVRGHQIVQPSAYGRLPRRDVRTRGALKETDIEMQVAIAGVPVGDERPLRDLLVHPGRGLCHELRQPRDGH